MRCEAPEGIDLQPLQPVLMADISSRHSCNTRYMHTSKILSSVSPPTPLTSTRSPAVVYSTARHAGCGWISCDG
ncbi:hypothetical protein E2C01_013292 [Portunus trituberculatus]|uniref:Uncharacterized protein n=1 Tax=Portunus trituberculatus TaxID=210409 RepID=A0A5B7DFT9_PORTR|nr:hypothetical protein [Portunus trituberculatus]